MERFVDDQLFSRTPVPKQKFPMPEAKDFFSFLADVIQLLLSCSLRTHARVHKQLFIYYNWDKYCGLLRHITEWSSVMCSIHYLYFVNWTKLKQYCALSCVIVFVYTCLDWSLQTVYTLLIVVLSSFLTPRGRESATIVLVNFYLFCLLRSCLTELQ